MLTGSTFLPGADRNLLRHGRLNHKLLSLLSFPTSKALCSFSSLPHGDMPFASIARYAVVLGAAVLFSSLPFTEASAQYFRYGKNKVHYDAHDWQFVQSKHFDVYYYDGGYYLADFTAKAAEDAYEHISELFQHEISDRIPLIVYQSHNDFAVTNAVELPTYSEGIGGVTELFKNRVAIPFTGDYRDYRRVVHHELVHAVINDMFYGGSIQSIIQNNIQLRIPLWFNEGLAEYSALGWDSNSDMYIRDAILEDYLAPIPYLSGYFAYRGGQSVWDYVGEQYGREKIGEILQRLRLTRSIESAFGRATGLKLEELSERWQKTLKEAHFPEMAAREDLGEIGKALITRDEGNYNTSPAMSPRGDQIAFLTTRGAFFDVYLADANDGEIIRKLIEGQNNTEFESLKLLTPGITWSPDGEKIAVAVKSGPSDAIAIIDVDTKETVHYRVPDVDQIISISWSPAGDKLAFEASMNAQSDIYVLSLETHETINYTGDIFSDHEPSWSPDGSYLLFHSDRGSHTDLGRFHEENFQMIDYDFSQDDVYLLRLGESRVERLTFDELWDDRSAKFAPSGDKVLFISDRNGIYNLYEKELTGGAVRPLTDVSRGIIQVSLSADAQKAALVSLKEGTPSIFMMKSPFDRRLDRDELTPTVWAQRVMQETTQPAPAVALAQNSLLQNNPLLRDATDGVAYAYTPGRRQTLLASRTALTEPSADSEEPESEEEFSSDPADSENLAEAEEDSSVYGGVRVDFRNYVFSDSFDEAVEDEPDPVVNRFEPPDNMDEDGDYKPRKYKLTFSPDVVYGTAGYDALYGVQGVTQMMFSDMLGNHQIFVATNLLIDLRNSDYILAYNYLPNRIDWGVQGHHVSRLLPDYQRLTYYRYRQYGSSITASYPLDKFRRLDAGLSLMGVSQADISDPTVEPMTRTLLHPSLTFTKDVTTPGLLYPVGGSRLAVSVSGSPGLIGGRDLQFATLLADTRAYVGFARNMYSFAFRLSGGTSVGSGQQLFYSSGVQNWINRHFDDANGFPIEDITDFIFATPVLPLRGYEINAQNGSHFGLFNAEFRFPLVAAVLPGPIPLIPLYNIQGSAFLDAGGIWGGKGLDKRFNFFTDDADGDRVFDDLLVGAGFGLRTILLGYPVRVDFAWPYDGQRFGDRTTYFSVGLDF